MKFLENEFREIELSEKFNFENARRLLLSDLITIEGKRKLKKYLSNFSFCVRITSFSASLLPGLASTYPFGSLNSLLALLEL